MFIERLIPHYKLKESFDKEYRKILANAKGKKVFARLNVTSKNVIPALYRARDKLQRESRSF